MRIFLFLFLLSAFSFSLNVTHFLNIETEIICPDNDLVMTAIASNGSPAPAVELRVVLHSPYQGLRAVKTTDKDGIAVAELTKTGLYRIYINTEFYNHDDFVEFNYSELCPAPPPKQFNISVIPLCNQSQLMVQVAEDDVPLQDVFVRTLNWSSTTNNYGQVILPLDEGYVYIVANKSGFVRQEFWIDINCTPAPPPPSPECLQNPDCAPNQICENETCVNISGTCGYAENHSWIDYACCEDNDCGYKMICENNSCIIKPAPKPNITENISSNDSNKSTLAEDEGPSQIQLGIIAAILILLIITGYFVLKKK
ncbi:hypothetical protein KKE92_01755 [Candidatus Micrarchaeota archaeon]|nr:hypothetical protein [Candidatus Micrarchaeota archaeon]MBU1682139.1 hypothetical protein [Candidatus Micrarchaeota archaeon]